MNCRKCGKPGGEQITDIDGNFLIRCLACIMDMAREAEQAMADAVEEIMQIEIGQAAHRPVLEKALRNAAEAERKLAEGLAAERHMLKESAIELHGDCMTLVMLAARDMHPEDAARVREAAAIARAKARKVLTRRAMHTLGRHMLLWREYDRWVIGL